MILLFEDNKVVGEVRGVVGFLVLNPLWYGIWIGRGGRDGDSCLTGVFGLP